MLQLTLWEAERRSEISSSNVENFWASSCLDGACSRIIAYSSPPSLKIIHVYKYKTALGRGGLGNDFFAEVQKYFSAHHICQPVQFTQKCLVGQVFVNNHK